MIATGALSIPTLGGSDFGYAIARKFGLKADRAARRACTLYVHRQHKKLNASACPGSRWRFEVRCNDQSFTENMLFTHRGLSGPAILQISNYWHPGDLLIINLFPEIDAHHWLLDTKRSQPSIHLKTLLSQVLAKSLVTELMQEFWSTLDGRRLDSIADAQLCQVAQQLQHWALKPAATEGYRTAEVTLGGVCADGISSKTMEAKDHTGLFLSARSLDVSGHLGGFKLSMGLVPPGHCAGQCV